MDHYEILGISPSASDELVRVAYRQRLKEVHPDTGSSDSNELDQVKQAGQVLLSAPDRAKYDGQLSATRRNAIDDDRNRESPGPFAIAAGLLVAALIGIGVLVVAPWSSDEMSTDVASAQVVAADDATVAAESTPLPTEAPTAFVATAAPTVASTSVVDVEEATPTDESEQNEQVAAPAVAAPDDADAAEAPDAADEDLPDLADLPERGAIYRAPTLFLVGPVPSQEIADAFYAKAVAVVGEENVVNEYIVHPDAPANINGNVRVEQAIQFETASAVIRPAFLAVLGLAQQVLVQNPQASLVVQGHTDNIGAIEANQALSEARAQAVTNWLVDQGIAADRLTAIGFGESQPFADNADEAGRSINRRIEVEMTDLLS